MTANQKIPDVCIVGAGLVGSLIAYELATLGYRVTVLESGPRHLLADRPAAMERALLDDGFQPWASELPQRDTYTTSGDLQYPLNRMRVKAVGGSTLHWGANALRLVDSDFKMKTLYGIADDWPIGYRDLEPYYAQAERALGVVGIADNPFASFRSGDFPYPGFPYSYVDRFFEKACASLGVQLHHVPYARNIQPNQGRPACQAFGTCETKAICPISAQYTAETHIDWAVATGKAELIAEANVIHINAGRSGKIESVTYVTKDKVQHEQAARIFVLAAHTVETARLLLLSTSSRFPQGMANSSGLVGRNFMEHPGLFVQGKIKERTYPFRIGFHTAESHQFIDPSNRGEISGVKFDFTNIAGSRPDHMAGEGTLWGDELAERVRHGFGRTVGMYVQAEQLANAQCYVALDDSKRDVFGNPVPHVAYSLSEYERQSRDYHVKKLAIPILEAMGAVDITVSDIVFSAHHMGTCRMGTDPEKSVVDEQCRTHDVENLFVVGGSVFVTAAVLQPSLTMAALALRAAEFIARTYPAS